jgi:FkbM family methyltransferase
MNGFGFKVTVTRRSIPVSFAAMSDTASSERTREIRERLKRQSELYSASPLAKLLRMPWSMLRTKLRERHARQSSAGQKVRAKTFWGDEMTVVFPEVVSVAIARYSFHESELTNIVIECVKPGMTFFDIGAHFGYFTLLAAHLVGEGGSVHAFDPTPSTFAILSENAAARRNVVLNNLAVHRDDGSSITLSDFGLAFSAFNTVASPNLDEQTRAALQPKTVTVPTVSIDEYVRRTGARPGFVKIDAEGAELSIVQGMTRTLAEIRPMITLEVGDFSSDGGESESSRAPRLLAEMGYTPMEWHENGLRPHTFQSRYTYGNLLFVPKQGSVLS